MSSNVTQKFVYETDSIESLKKVLTTIADIMFGEIFERDRSVFVNSKSREFDDGAFSNESVPKYTHICSVEKGYRQPRDGDTLIQNLDDLIEHVMEDIETADQDAFIETCGDGHNDNFNDYDGSVDVGYRLKGVWGRALELSLCHIYYGK